jgi:hypothetical protein
MPYHKNSSAHMTQALTWGRPDGRPQRAQWLTESRASTRYTGVPVGNSAAAKQYDINAQQLTNPERYANAPLPPFSPQTVSSEVPVELTVKQPIVLVEEPSVEEAPIPPPRKPTFHCYGNGNVEPSAGGVLWKGYMQTKNVKCAPKRRSEVSRHALRAANRRIGAAMAAKSPARLMAPSPQIVWTRSQPRIVQPEPVVALPPPPPPLPPAGKSLGWSEGGTALALRWAA